MLYRLKTLCFFVLEGFKRDNKIENDERKNEK